MAEQDRSQRTEQPTEKRLREARERAQVPRSRELGMAAVVLTATAYLVLARSELGARLERILAEGLMLDLELLGEPSALPQALGAALLQGLVLLAPLAAVTVTAAVVASLGLGGWTFSWTALEPKLERLDPVAGLKRVFGLNGLVELAKALAKFALVAAVGTLLLWGSAEELLGLGRLSIGHGLGEAGRLIAASAFGLAAVLLLIAAADVPFQWWQHRDRLKMTKQEVKDELRDTEGKPELRSRIRSLQHEIATRRMMEEVPRADVVAMNPTHFAVALRYESGRMRAPKVVAKGADLVALRIREVASAHGVPIFEHPPLAQALYFGTKLGSEISPRLYAAVAQVLTYVYQLRRAGRAHAGLKKPEISIDPELVERLKRPQANRRGVHA